MRKDGPPDFYVDETKVPNAVPRVEPLAPLGNMHSYRVFGRRYFTLKSSKHYQAVGIASWYGTLFHKHRTSSGEPYNMLAMTAAHKTLPLPTYVEVTNLHNNRKVIVKVNDRGPFESNRLIDLSYVAAKKLGMIGHGTTLVRIKAIDPHTWHKHLIAKRAPHSEDIFADESSPPSFQPLWTNNENIHFVYVQVGAFRNKISAEKLQQRLFALLGTPVKITKLATKHLYRVQVGPLKDIATADKITQQLNDLGIKTNKTIAS